MTNVKPNSTDGYIHRGTQGATTAGDSILMVVPLESAAVEAISKVHAAHSDEFDEALAPFGLSHLDLLMPDWTRPMRKSDLERLEYMGADL